MLKQNYIYQHDKFSVQFFPISTCLGPQMATADPNFSFKFLYVGSVFFRRQTSLPFSFLSFLNFLFIVPFSFIHSLNFSRVIFGYFQSSWYSIPLLPKHIYFIGIRRNPMYVILNRVHRCRKAKQNTVLFFEFPELLFEDALYLKSVSLSNLKSTTVCTPKKLYAPSG